MKPVYRYLLFVLLAILPAEGGLLHAQYAKVPTDSSQLSVRNLPANELKKYRNDEEFNYREHRAEGMSLWDRFWLWLFSRGQGTGKYVEIIVKLLLWGLCLFVLVYAILKLTGMSGIGLFTGNKKSEELDYAVTSDDIYAINFSEAIADAAAKKNYRLGIRLLYLQTLRRLADRELIRWKLNKTNDVYAQELTGSNYYNDFAWLTRVYDYAWYGDFPVQEAQFTEVQQHFKTFQQQLPA